MYKGNLKINDVLKTQGQKRPSSKTKMNFVDYYLSRKDKNTPTVQFIKKQPVKSSLSKSKKQNRSMINTENTTTIQTKHNSPHIKSNKSQYSHHMKNKSINYNNYLTTNQNLNCLRKDLFKNVNKSTAIQNKSIITKHKKVSNKSMNIISNEFNSRKKYHQVSRSNSISNLEQTTTLTSSTTNTSKRINKKKNTQKQKETIQVLQTEETNFNYKPHITEVNIIETKKNYKSDNYITTNIITANEYDLLSEDSVFNYSKNTSNNVTNNNSKEKNIKTISGNNDSGHQTISYTYSDDEGSVTKKTIDKRTKQNKQTNMNTHNNMSVYSEDFLTFCAKMNQKLFSK